MAEYFIITNSFAAPFCSDTDHKYVEADSPQQALTKAASEYRHPYGLYAAAAYTSSDAKNKGEEPLARWLCNQAKRLEGVTGSITNEGQGRFIINGERVVIEDWMHGSVVE